MARRKRIRALAAARQNLWNWKRRASCGRITFITSATRFMSIAHLARRRLSSCRAFRRPREVQPGSLVAPLPGVVDAVKVAVGDLVAAGDVLVVIESMKIALSGHRADRRSRRRAACAKGNARRGSHGAGRDRRTGVGRDRPGQHICSRGLRPRSVGRSNLVLAEHPTEHSLRYRMKWLRSSSRVISSSLSRT